MLASRVLERVQKSSVICCKYFLLRAIQLAALTQFLRLLQSKVNIRSGWLSSSLMRIKNYINAAVTVTVVFACVTIWKGPWVGYELQLFQTVLPDPVKYAKPKYNEKTKLAALNWRSKNTYSTPTILCYAGSHSCLSGGRSLEYRNNQF